MKIKKQLLLGGWWHAHEEDSPKAIIFHPDSLPAPQARGRIGYMFSEDGTVVKRGFAPDDRRTQTHGKWKLDTNGHLTISMSNAPDEVFDIESLDIHQLVIKKY